MIRILKESETKREAIFAREDPVGSVEEPVREIIAQVRAKGDEALKRYTKEFDGVDITLVAPLDEDDPVPSCRNADGPYHQGQYVLTVDGFLVSANVEVQESQVIETGFAYSDHEPVEMTFVLK